MTAIPPGEIRNIAIIGHKGSGKTSLAEAMLFVAKATAKLGKVDDKSSVLDDTVEEREHACTLESSVAHLFWNGRKVNVVDTPGEGSFLAERDSLSAPWTRLSWRLAPRMGFSLLRSACIRGPRR